MSNFKMDDYVPVNERIAALKAEFPEGCLQSEIVELTTSRVTVKAYAYRTPGDERPGIGHSSLEIPGATSFTRGSEIENAETSAWGRAIAALGFEVKRGLASAEEVRNKQPEQRGPAKAAPTPNAAPASYRRADLAKLMVEHNLDNDAVLQVADRIGISQDERPMSDESMDRLIAAIETPQPDSLGSGSATVQAVASPPGDEPARAPTLDDVLEAAGPGAELVPPAPGSDAFKALDSKGKLEARVWHQTHPAEAVA